SLRANWKIEDLIGGEKRLDFDRPFMPETFARVADLDFLNDHEKRLLNQIRGRGYLNMFAVVEEFILPFVMDHVRPELHGDDYRVRALLQFATEEAKHIHLFKCFLEAFDGGFGTACNFIGPADEIGDAVLAHDPLAVGLVILMIEWMTQAHYVGSVKDDTGLDPMFANLLRNHWMEEAQHAKLDTLIVETLAATYTPAKKEKAMDDFFAIGAMVDGALAQQVAFDVDAFERASGYVMTAAERERFTAVQHQAQRWTYLGSGMRHPNFLASIDALGGTARQRIDEATPVFSM
ncbi:MAG: hypothetical protein WD470_11250, partial [Rhodospirillaceae bacterium]